MKLGSIELPRTAALAPMAGVADRAFRELCVEYGACWCVAEMASAKGLTLSGRKTDALLNLSAAERPAAVQLFGDDPATMAQAAKLSLAHKPEAIDINMGCPAPKVAGNGGGSALLRDPKLAGEIIAAVVQAVDIPVTVKIRKGWDESNVTALEVAKRAEEAGAAMLTIHGRTRVQMYAPPVDRDIIRQVKEALTIPVVGNGDITTPQEAKSMYEETGCDLVMIGRGALGRPWLFSQIKAYLEEGILLPDPKVEERMAVMLRHMEMICGYKNEYVGMREARKHAAWYFTGLRGAAKLRKACFALESLDDAKRLAEEIIKLNPDA
ncbi:MAG: tRNA dihydrouridine synthase DusB [Oscillospiraceae bacterium]|nr:tRNA dihydrouridine synthase DusB [Oscillospiraceae bacterium]MBQ9109148.1 tRNA dihydrouridine synthase DusB [Oscillospiraceae bacterium]